MKRLTKNTPLAYYIVRRNNKKRIAEAENTIYFSGVLNCSYVPECKEILLC